MIAVRVVTLAAVIVATACGDNDPGVGFRMLATADIPAYGDVPFPTDAAIENGRLAVKGLDRIADLRLDLIETQLGALDGYGVRPLVEMFAEAPLDEDSLPTITTSTDDIAGLIDVDLDSPERGRVIAMDWHYDPDREVLAGSPRPGEVLREGTRYAAWVTTDVRSSGVPLHPVSRAGLDHPRWASTLAALDGLDQLAGHEIAGIAAFTTQHASAPLVAARDVMTTLPPPELAFPDPDLGFTGARLDAILGTAARFTDGPRTGLEHWGNDNPTGIAHDHVGAIVTGTITIARFRRDDTGTDLPDDETFELDGDGVPRVVAIEPIPITFIVPATPSPPAGYPVVIYGHGLGASRDQLLSFAEPLTSQGYALVGIDMVGHGSRFDPGDRVANMAGQLSAFSGDPSQRDGFGDTTGATTQFEFFEGFQNVLAVRDAIRQSALDLSRVAQLVHAGVTLPDGTQLDPARVAYLGESFGTVVGTLFAAIEPTIDLYVLDVPGGGILDRILPNSPEIGQLALPLIETLYHPHARLDRWNPLIGLVQATIDGGDPLTYAPHVLRDRFAIDGTRLGPRSVVAIEVVGDQILPNVATEPLARELGLDVLVPNLVVPDGMQGIPAPATANLDGQTAVLVQYSPATHGANWTAEHGTLRFLPGFPADGDDPFPRLPEDITIANPIYETLDQVFDILATHRTGVPRVISTLAPVSDFDGDGVPDDTDRNPYDPSMR